MGADWSRFSYFNPYHRATANTTVAERDDENLEDSGENSTEHDVSTGPDWTRLPYPVLLQVLQLLDETDRYHAALTCTAWLLPLPRPLPCRTGHFKFNPATAQKALQCARDHGKSLRHITADCSVLDNGQRKHTEVVHQFIIILLQADNQQLLTLRLTNMSMLTPDTDHPVSNLVKSLSALLKHQHQLVVLDLSQAGLNVNQGLRLLNSATLSSDRTLKTLAIDELIGLNLSFDHLAFQELLICVIRCTLSELDLSYTYLSDNLLYSLALKGRDHLKLMTIRARYKFLVQRVTTAPAWQSLTHSCPSLKVVFYIIPQSDSCSDRSLCNMLTPSLPLHALYWGSEASRTHITHESFQHIATHFQNSLHHLHLHYNFDLNMDGVANLYNSCHNLKTLALCKVCNSEVEECRQKMLIGYALARHPTNPACSVTFNGVDVSGQDPCHTVLSMVGWCCEQVKIWAGKGWTLVEMLIQDGDFKENPHT